ncbi:MAG: glycosyltransferase family 39 protein [Sinimarinibacterium sp.]|jgi:4-amino-4-deoxy-L-arabinose transferase-like glycosyltransferase
MSAALSTRQRGLLVTALLLILLIRVLSLGAYPLTDTTEARYGEMVRKMVELGDWVTPWFDYGVPFWGKPPLAFWLSAVSAKVLGVSEFSLRLPSFLLGVGMLALIGSLARRQRSEEQAWIAMLVLASTVVFFVSAGAVLTDTTLAFTTALAMVAFWRGVASEGQAAPVWRYVFFIALGLGLLAKGPVSLALVGAPILAWTLICGELWRAVRTLPWPTGIALTALIALPWYVIAEQHTPGFLSYFLVGENFLRFVDSTWPGDLYGGVHTRPKGYIWLLWMGAAFPWSVLLLWHVMRLSLRRGRGAVNSDPYSPDTRSWRIYVLCFTLSPCVFFTFAGSVLPTYVLPGMPALALYAAEFWPTRNPQRDARRAALTAIALPVLFAIAVPFLDTRIAADKSQRDLLEHLPSGASVIYYPKRPFSAQYYSQGRALVAGDEKRLEALLGEKSDSYLATRADLGLPTNVASHYVPIAQVGRRKPFVLWAQHADQVRIDSDAPVPSP